MKKNQKNTQEEMYLAIELWKESGLSQKNYCSENGIVYNTFKYWVKKYNGKKKPVKPQVKTFLPIQVNTTPEAYLLGHSNNEITITYPNGIEIKCPVDISTLHLKTLLAI
jgi:hypothetical protein